MTHERCPSCGRVAFFRVLDVWATHHEFEVEACCEVNQRAWLDEIPTTDRRQVAAWFTKHTGLPCRQVFVDEDRGQIRVDFGLEIVPISRKEAQEFVRQHHAHHPPPAGDKYRYGVRNGDTLVAVAIIGRPVARKLDDGTALEVNRVCVNHDQHPALVWNACSMLYGAAAREAKQRGYRRILTYLLESENGTSVRAAGWTATATTSGGSWNRARRARTDKAPTCPKIRWERALA